MNQTEAQLLSHQDLKFKAFTAKLMPEIDPDTVLGVRMPVLRQMAKTMDDRAKTAFMNELPHHWHEENMLHILLLDRIRDPRTAWEEYGKLQPCIRTWALTDALSLKSLSDEFLLEKSLMLLESDDSWIRRQAVVWIMKRGLKKEKTLEMVQKALRSYRGEREVRLALGWLLCEGMCQNRDLFFPFLLNAPIDLEVFRTAVSKCRDSTRVSRADVQELKDRLAGLKTVHANPDF